jgi:hypothetical protein
MDKECHISGEIADMGQIHPKMSQEGRAHFVVDKRIAPDLSALGMARLLPQILSTGNLEISRCCNRFYILDCDA